MARETYNTDLLFVLVQNTGISRRIRGKKGRSIFHSLRQQIASRCPTVEYLSGKHDVILAAFAGYQNEEVAMNTCMILEEMLRHEQLCKILLYCNE